MEIKKNPDAGAAEIISATTLALPIDRAAVAVGVTRTRLFEAVRGNELTARKAGKATIVEVSELHRWLRSLPTRGRQPEPAAA